jgi:6-pyruvoyltetrahydropterin/6-carboxytetrahydropterin synthase
MPLVHSYKIKTYVNASHAMRWKDGEGKQHNHTWEVVCEIKSKDDAMIVFRDIEQKIQDVLGSFSGQFLNQLPYFESINPTVENVTIWLFDLITPEMEKLSAELTRIEVGESPTRSYVITAS